MKRYEFNMEPLDTDESPDGSFVLYEEARVIEVDRDIKAANLQLLVEKVLALETALEASDQSANAALEDTLQDAVQAAGIEMVDLARSLKQ